MAVTRLLMLKFNKKKLYKCKANATFLFFFTSSFFSQTPLLFSLRTKFRHKYHQLYCHLYTFLTYLLKDYFNYLMISNKKKLGSNFYLMKMLNRNQNYSSFSVKIFLWDAVPLGCKKEDYPLSKYETINFHKMEVDLKPCKSV